MLICVAATSSSACPIINEPEGTSTMPKGVGCFQPLRPVAVISPFVTPTSPPLPLLPPNFDFRKPQPCKSSTTAAPITNRVALTVNQLYFIIVELLPSSC